MLTVSDSGVMALLLGLTLLLLVWRFWGQDDEWSDLRRFGLGLFAFPLGVTFVAIGPILAIVG